MDKKEQDDFVTGQYAYGEIERALGLTLGADETAQRGPLRGRLKHFAKLGLPAGGPGKGARRRYSKDEAYQLLLALLLADLGIDPTLIVPKIPEIWRFFASRVRAADSAPANNPMMLIVQVREVVGPWGKKEPLWVSVTPHIDEKAKARYAQHRFRDESDNVAKMLRNQPDWVCVLNLTDKVLKLNIALPQE
jgi:hypothetical protein